MLYHGGRIFTDEKGEARGEAMLVGEDGRIVAVGQEEEVRRAATDADSHDLAGLLVLPAFVDAHTHLSMLGSSLKKTDLVNCKSLGEITTALRSRLEEQPGTKRLLAKGWMQASTNGVALASSLDEISSTVPIFVESKDLHSSWCNTAALSEMGLLDDASLKDPTGGTIERDEQGRPNGLLSEAANVTIVWPHLAKVTAMEEKMADLEAAFRSCLAAGCTTAVDMAMDEAAWEALQTMSDRPGGLPVRVSAHWFISPTGDKGKDLAQVRRAVELYSKPTSDGRPTISGIKVMVDGVVDACTAALREPYASRAPPGHRGSTLWTREELEPVVKAADEAGLQVALHAIGDAAVALAIDCLEACAGEDPASLSSRRHRIEHLEICSAEDVQRLGRLGIVASVQPVHCDPAILQAWPSLLSKSQCSRAFAYSEFLHHGAPLAIGSDAPTAPHHPLPNLYIASTRLSARQPSLDLPPFNPQFALDRLQALRAASKGGAFSCFRERDIGSLEVGKMTDFILVDGDILRDDPQTLLSSAILATYVGGQRAYGA